MSEEEKKQKTSGKLGGKSATGASADSKSPVPRKAVTLKASGSKASPKKTRAKKVSAKKAAAKKPSAKTPSGASAAKPAAKAAPKAATPSGREKPEAAKPGPKKPGEGIKVALFVTCLVDLVRPNIGFSTLKLLEDAGCTVEVPESQTCCGQPAFNSGDFATSRDMAINFIHAFEDYDYIVAPSGSCAGMVREHYAELFEDEPEWAVRAERVSKRTYEIVSFLVDVLGITEIDAEYEGSVTYHDSCSGLRELGIHAQPRRLLGSVRGLEVKEMVGANVCCGFGGTFCVKYPEISNKMVGEKTQNIKDSGADTLLAGDLGCLMNMAGKLKREGSPIKVRHVAEVLAGMADGPAIGDGQPGGDGPGTEGGR